MNPLCQKAWDASDAGNDELLEAHARACPACQAQWRVHRALSRTLRTAALPSLGAAFDRDSAIRREHALHLVPLARSARLVLLCYWMALVGVAVAFTWPPLLQKFHGALTSQYAPWLVPLGFALALSVRPALRRAANMARMALAP